MYGDSNSEYGYSGVSITEIADNVKPVINQDGRQHTVELQSSDLNLFENKVSD